MFHNMATTNEPTRDPSVSASLEKEKIEVEQRENEIESAPTAEEIEFKKQERKVVAKLDLVRPYLPSPVSQNLTVARSTSVRFSSSCS